jgi:signal transduction histidine kinase
MKVFRIIFLILFLFPVYAGAQVTYGIRQYSTENGLPSNGIKGLQWDESTGFLWIATEAGMVRFNGMEFQNLTGENSRMASDRMLFLIRNHSGQIYTADQGGNIFTIDKFRIKYVEQYNKNDLRYDNLYLFATSHVLLSKYRKSKSQFNLVWPFDQLHTVDDTSFFALKNGILYYQTLNLGRRQLNLSHPEKLVSLVRINDSIFLFDGKNDLYQVETDGSMKKFELVDENGKKLEEPGQQFLFGTNGMTKPVLFIGSKAWLLKKENGVIRASVIATNIPTDAFVRYVQYSEKRKLLFIGTDSKGFFVIEVNKVRQVKRNNQGIKQRNAYYGQIELSNGNILTNEGHVIGENDTPASLPVKGPFIFSIFTTPDSLGWYSRFDSVSGFTHLFNYNFKNNTTTAFPKVKITGSMAVAKSGNDIYIAQQHGISRIAGEGDKLLYPFPGLNRIVYDMQVWDSENLVIASCMGLLKYNIVQNRLDTLFSINDYCVRALWKYKDYLFFGTYGKGFYALKDGVVKPLPLDKNKYLLYAHCFMPDGLGYCYISTNRGLFKASIEEMIEAWEGEREGIYYHYFGKNDGMESTEMNGGCKPCAIQLKNKVLSFPTMDGLLWIDPVRADPVLPEGEIYLDEYIADNRKINVDTVHPVSLPSGTKEIIFKIAFSAWCNKENIYIEYQLNDSVSWKRLNAENGSQVSFNNLPPGNYSLRFRKLNGFGRDNYSYKTISFNIVYPWYLSWWFFVLAAILVFGLLLGFFNYRTRRYQKAQQKLEAQVAEKTRELSEKNIALEKAGVIKSRLISIISHDIVTPLKFVTVAAKNLAEKKGQMPEDLQNETISEIATTSQELQFLSTNILNWIKYQNENRRLVKERFNVHAMVNSVLGVLGSLGRHKGIEVVNHVDQGMEILQYYEPLKILVYNLVTNSINFSEKGRIEISGMLLENEVQLRVKDEGAGMTPEQVNNIMSDPFIISSANFENKKGNGLGYLIIKDLLKVMGGRITINSERNKGTTVIVSLPFE